MKVIIFLLVALCGIHAQNSPVIVTTGGGLSALSWNGIGRAELTTGNNQRLSLSYNLPKTFTFECWFLSPKTDDGRYKNIVSRYRSGPGKSYFHNKWADFVFQLQKDGMLNIFMGNGWDNIYGINMASIYPESNKWNHAAFTVYHPQGNRNPAWVRIYINGLEFTQSWAEGGDRQELRNVPITLGDYQNQDGLQSPDLATQNWVGLLDEVRFWSGIRTTAQLIAYRNLVVPIGTSGTPLAYYQFNNPTRYLLDNTGNFHGQISQTRGSVAYGLSGAKVNVNFAINHTETRSFVLPGNSLNGSAGFTYVVSSLPADSSGNLAGSLWTPEGVAITSVPFALLGNVVVYQAPPNVNCDIAFTYYGQTPLHTETSATTVYIAVGDAPCSSSDCGRCPGIPRLSFLDQPTCNCLNLPYFGYNYTDIERIVYLFEVEKTIDLMHQLEGKLERVMRLLSRYPATYDLVVLINEVQAFNRGCLRQFCDTFTSLIAKVSAAPELVAPLSRSG